MRPLEAALFCLRGASARVLDVLADGGRIDGWAVVEPSNVPFAMVSGHLVWLVPEYVDLTHQSVM